MRKFFLGLAILATCATINFGLSFEKVEAAENFDADLTSSISEDLNINAEETESKAIKIFIGNPPRHRQPPPPPPRRPAPPPPHFGHRPPPHNYDPPHRHHSPGSPPRHHRPGSRW